MSKKPETKRAVAEASVTLPEGAVVSVSKYDKFTEVHATRNDKELRMRVDNVSSQTIGTYLMMFCREVARRRALITEKPTYVPFSPKPKNIDEFVKHMAVQDMFIFEALVPEVDETSSAPIHDDGGKNEVHLYDKKKKPRKSAKKKTKEKPISVEEIKLIFPDAQLLKN